MNRRARQAFNEYQSHVQQLIQPKFSLLTQYKVDKGQISVEKAYRAHCLFHSVEALVCEERFMKTKGLTKEDMDIFNQYKEFMGIGA